MGHYHTHWPPGGKCSIQELAQSPGQGQPRQEQAGSPQWLCWSPCRGRPLATMEGGGASEWAAPGQARWVPAGGPNHHTGHPTDRPWWLAKSRDPTPIHACINFVHQASTIVIILLLFQYFPFIHLVESELPTAMNPNFLFSVRALLSNAFDLNIINPISKLKKSIS